MFEIVREGFLDSCPTKLNQFKFTETLALEGGGTMCVWRFMPETFTNSLVRGVCLPGPAHKRCFDWGKFILRLAVILFDLCVHNILDLIDMCYVHLL